MRALVDLIAPERCVGCGAEASGELCLGCAQRIVVIEPACGRCGSPHRVPWRQGRVCACSRVVGFGRARSLVAFAEPARSLTLALKRRASTSVAAGMGTLLASLARCEGLAPRATAVTFVPGRGPATLNGADHCETLARAVAGSLDVPVVRPLGRDRQGPRQSDVPLARRWSNVAGRFSARPVSGHILLVDDVYTTGATVQECGRALLRAGASSVDVVTWARTLLREYARPGAILPT